MKVLYLDFDGVLNPFNNYSAKGDFSKSACKNLNKILKEEPELKIVVSSSWRRDGLEKVRKILQKNGIDSSKVIGITDETERDDRGHHIERHLKDHKDIESFVILDDHADMDKVLDRLVQTNPSIGLTSKDAEKALKILKK